MHEEKLSIQEADLKIQLLPRLVGNVFHVTTIDGLKGIRQREAIESNQRGQLPFTLSQSKVSFFRKRGCVSVFDLRITTTVQIEDTLLKYFFLCPLFTSDRPVFLFLSPLYYELIIPWSDSLLEGPGAMVIPYAEAGYPGHVPLSVIDSLLEVEVLRESNVEKLRKLRLTHTTCDALPLDLLNLICKASGNGLTEEEKQELKEWEPSIAALGKQIVAARNERDRERACSAMWTR